jgi:hypothetical protein
MFDFQDNFGVFIGTSPNTLFRLNVSPLNGTDVLANDSVPLVEYVDFSQYCTEVQIENGVSAIGTTIDIGYKGGTLILARQDADPLAGYFTKVGSPIQFTFKNYPFGGSNLNWFFAYIKSIQRDTDATGLTRVVINFGDQIEQLMNTETTISVATDQTFAQRWTSIYDVVAGELPVLTTKTASGFTFPGIDIFETPLRDTINETMQGELGWLVTGRLNGIYPMSHSYLTSTLEGAHSYEIHQDVTDHHIPPTYINVSSDSQSIVSTINASLSWDAGTTFTIVDNDQADLYGNSTLDIAVNLADETNLSNWCYYAITLTGQQNIKALSVDGIDHRNAKLHDVYVMEPGECVLVNVQKGGISVNENYLISKVIHTITPDTWQTDLELWRN